MVDGSGDLVESSWSPSPDAIEAARAAVEGTYRPNAPVPLIPTAPVARPSSEVALALVAKFPDWNPDWNAKTQAAWFDGFARLMDIVREG